MVDTLDKIHAHVKTAMNGKIPDGMSLFGYSTTNHIGGSGTYLYDTPHGCFTSPGDLWEGHSQRFPDAIQKAISEAKGIVDVLNMDAPDWNVGDPKKRAFRNALIAGLAALAKSGRTVSVRLLFGKVFGQLRWGPDTYALLEEIREAVRPFTDRQITVWAGAICWTTTSWNHAKLVAVDGKTMITGGHNMWSDAYLDEKEAAFDLSLKLDGPIAKGGHDFANGLWNFVKPNPRTPGTYFHCLHPNLEIDYEEPTGHQAQSEAQGQVPAMWVTNPGWGVFQKDGKDILDSTMWIAFLKGLESAKHCRIAAQTFAARGEAFSNHGHYATGTYHGYTNEFIVGLDPHLTRFLYDLRLIDGLRDFIGRSEANELEIVVSPSEAGGYGRGEPSGQIFDLIAWRLHLKYPGNSKDYWVKRLNKQVTLVYPQMRNPDWNGTKYQRWVRTKNLMVNHSKFWMLDSKLFYVGSENLYPSTGFPFPPFLPVMRIDASLYEFGVIVEADQTIAAMMLQEYFHLLWHYGERREAAKADLMWKE